jgi:hypothetical protein
LLHGYVIVTVTEKAGSKVSDYTLILKLKMDRQAESKREPIYLPLSCAENRITPSGQIGVILFK